MHSLVGLHLAGDQEVEGWDVVVDALSVRQLGIPGGRHILLVDTSKLWESV